MRQLNCHVRGIARKWILGNTLYVDRESLVLVVVVFPFSKRRPEPQRNVSIAAVRGSVRPSIQRTPLAQLNFIFQRHADFNQFFYQWTCPPYHLDESISSFRFWRFLMDVIIFYCILHRNSCKNSVDPDQTLNWVSNVCILPQNGIWSKKSLNFGVRTFSKIRLLVTRL